LNESLYSSSFEWKTSQLAIRETPSEPLIAMMNDEY
jgi:hypothetical protein